MSGRCSFATVMFWGVLCFPMPVLAQAPEARKPIPLGEIELEPLRDNVDRLARTADGCGAVDVARACKDAVALAGPDAMQRRMDRLTGVVVELNPESRVKVDVRLDRLDLVATPTSAGLDREKSVRFPACGWVLVKVVNHCGAMAPLKVVATEEGESTPKTRWSLYELEGGALAGARPGPILKGDAGWRLTGAGVQYGLMECAGPATGSREVLLRFDAGVGTQDIGFRGEGTLLVKCGPRSDH
jgi:hypothetical protein